MPSSLEYELIFSTADATKNLDKFVAEVSSKLDKQAKKSSKTLGKALVSGVDQAMQRAAKEFQSLEAKLNLDEVMSGLNPLYYRVKDTVAKIQRELDSLGRRKPRDKNKFAADIQQALKAAAAGDRGAAAAALQPMRDYIKNAKEATTVASGEKDKQARLLEQLAEHRVKLERKITQAIHLEDQDRQELLRRSANIYDNIDFGRTKRSKAEALKRYTFERDQLLDQIKASESLATQRSGAMGKSATTAAELAALRSGSPFNIKADTPAKFTKLRDVAVRSLREIDDALRATGGAYANLATDMQSRLHAMLASGADPADITRMVSTGTGRMGELGSMDDFLSKQKHAALRAIQKNEELSATERLALYAQVNAQFAQLEADKTNITKSELDHRTKLVREQAEDELRAANKAAKERNATKTKEQRRVDDLDEARRTSPFAGDILAKTDKEYLKLRKTALKVFDDIEEAAKKAGKALNSAEVMDARNRVHDMLKSGTTTDDLKKAGKAGVSSIYGPAGDPEKEAKRIKKVDEQIAANKADINNRIIRDNVLSDTQKKLLQARATEEYARFESMKTGITTREAAYRTQTINAELIQQINAIKEANIRANNAQLAGQAGMGRRMQMVFQGQQVIEDFSFAGMRGITNNLAFMLSSVKGVTGQWLAMGGLIGIAAYSVYDMWQNTQNAVSPTEELEKHWERIARHVKTVTSMQALINEGVAETELPLDPDHFRRAQKQLQTMEQGFKDRFDMEIPPMPIDYAAEEEAKKKQLAELKAGSWASLGRDVTVLNDKEMRDLANRSEWILDNQGQTADDLVKRWQGMREQAQALEAQLAMLAAAQGQVDEVNKQIEAIARLRGELEHLERVQGSLNDASSSIRGFEKALQPDLTATPRTVQEELQRREKASASLYDEERDAMEEAMAKLIEDYQIQTKATLDAITGARERNDDEALKKFQDRQAKEAAEFAAAAQALEDKAGNLNDSQQDMLDYERDISDAAEETARAIEHSKNQYESLRDQAKQTLAEDMKRLQVLRETREQVRLTHALSVGDNQKTIVGMQEEAANKNIQKWADQAKQFSSVMGQLYPGWNDQWFSQNIDSQVKAMTEYNRQVAQAKQDQITMKQLGSLEGSGGAAVQKARQAAAKGETANTDRHFERARELYQQAQQMLSGELAKGDLGRADAIMAEIERFQRLIEQTFDMQDQANQGAINKDQQRLNEILAQLQKIDGMELMMKNREFISTVNLRNLEAMTAQMTQQLALAQGIANAMNAAGSPLGAADPSKPVIPGIPGKASGGPVNYGSPYWVGERGPELFIPSQSGTIINALMSQRLVTAGQGLHTPRVPTGTGTPVVNTFNYGTVQVAQPGGISWEEAQKRAAFTTSSNKIRRG